MSQAGVKVVAKCMGKTKIKRGKEVEKSALAGEGEHRSRKTGTWRKTGDEWHRIDTKPAHHTEHIEYTEGGVNASLPEMGVLSGSVVKGRRKLQGRINTLGMRISIENRAGSVRRGKGEDGKPWKTVMSRPYGYIRGIMGVDGDHLDVFVGPELEKMVRSKGKEGHFDKVWVVHQRQRGTKKYDEDKVMLGFKSKNDAVAAYKRHYDDPEKFIGPVSEHSLADFKKTVKDRNKSGKRIARGRMVRK